MTRSSSTSEVMIKPFSKILLMIFKKKGKDLTTEWLASTFSKRSTSWANLIYDLSIFSDIFPYFLNHYFLIILTQDSDHFIIYFISIICCFYWILPYFLLSLITTLSKINPFQKPKKTKLNSLNINFLNIQDKYLFINIFFKSLWVLPKW